MSGCLGPVAAALVDGELDHAARERAHRHVAHCAACRAEVEAQRRLKASLSRLAPAAPSGDLLARLHGLSRPPVDDLPAERVLPPAPTRPAAERGRPRPPVTVRPPASPTRPTSGRPAARAAALRSRPPVLSRRSAAGSAFAVLGVAAALALSAPPQRTVPAPAGSPSGVLLTEVAGGTAGPSAGRLGGGLGTVPAVLSPSLTGADRPEVPVRTALLTGVGGLSR